MRFVLLPLVDAHLPAPSLPAQHTAPGLRPRNLAGSHQPGLTPSAPPSPLAPGTPGVSSTVLRYLDFRPGLGPDLRDIAAQYSSDNPTPESQERDVVHEPVRCPAAPRDMCCDISSQEVNLGPKQAISQHTSLGAARFTAHMGEHCAAISQDLAPNLDAHPTKRSTLLPEGRSDSEAGRFEPGGRR